MQRFLLLLVAVSFLATASCLLLDPFTAFQSVVADEDNPVVTETILDAAVVGGRRDMTVTRAPGPINALQSSGAIFDGFWALSNDVGVQGSMSLAYPGADGNGFSPVNLVQNGQTCWNFRAIESNTNVTLSATFRDSVSSQDTIVATEIKDFIDAPVDVCVPFISTDLSSVDFAQYDIISLIPNTDVFISYVCSQPIVSCWHTISPVGNANIDDLNVGDAIEVSVTCRNYEAIPSATQDITASFVFDASIGTMSQPTCTGTTSSGVVNNNLDFTGTLDETDEASCTVTISMIAPGQVDDLSASVTTSAQENPPIRSNEGEDIQGTSAFCNPPNLSTITVRGQTDPPTAPVQRRCRSQRRCFRLSQQNPCIFASNCVDRVCSNFCFNTPECMLDPLCAGSFWEQV